MCVCVCVEHLESRICWGGKSHGSTGLEVTRHESGVNLHSGRQGRARGPECSLLGNNAGRQRGGSDAAPPTPDAVCIPVPTLVRPASGQVPPSPAPRLAPHPAAPAGASGGSARPSWGPAPSGWTSSHPRGSFGRTSRRGKPEPRRRGRRRLRRASHRIRSGPARVAQATRRPPPGHRRYRRRFSCGSRKKGRAGSGEGRCRKAVSTRNRRPRPAGGAGGPFGRGASARLSDPPRGGAPGAQSRRRESQRSLPLAQAVLQVPECTAKKVLQSGWSVLGTMGVNGLGLSTFFVFNRPCAASSPGKCSCAGGEAARLLFPEFPKPLDSIRQPHPERPRAPTLSLLGVCYPPSSL